MNIKMVLAGFITTLVVASLVLLAVDGLWKRSAADGKNRRVPEYAAEFDASREGLRRHLLEGLRSRVVQRRYFSVRAMGETRDPFFGGHLTPLLTTEDDSGVKGAVLEALAKIGGSEAEGAVMEALTKAVGHVKSEAAAAAGFLRNDTALQGLATALASKNTFVRGRAVDGIVNYAGDSKAVRELVARAARDEQFKVRERLANRTPDLPPSLRPYAARLGLADERPEIRRLALEKLEAAGVERPAAEMLRYLEDASPQVKAAAAKVCGQRRLTEAVPKLLALIDPGAPENLLAALATALGQIGDPQATDGLVTIYRQAKPFIPRGDALLALGRLGRKALRSVIREGLDHKKVYVRHRAALALHLLGEPGMLDIFRASLESDEVVTRANCVYTLGEEQRPEFIPILAQGALNDGDAKVRETAAKALLKMLDRPEALDCLGKVMKDSSPDVRYYVMAGFGEGAPPEVLPVVREATEDRAWTIRRLAYRYLVKHDPRGCVDLLKRGAKDIDWRVKTEVWAALYNILYR